MSTAGSLFGGRVFIDYIFWCWCSQPHFQVQNFQICRAERWSSILPSLPPTCSWTSLQQLKDVQLRGKLIQTKSNYCGSDTCKPKSRPIGQQTESRPARYNRTYWTMSHKWVSMPATPPVPPQHRAATGTNRTREPRTPEHRLQHVSRGCFFILKQ